MSDRKARLIAYTLLALFGLAGLAVAALRVVIWAKVLM